jgi:long-chain acyl-CoA synthetase
VLKLVDDAAAFQPTMFCGVPRVYDRIYGRVMGGVKEAGGLKKVLFEWGYNRKLHYMKLGKKQVEVGAGCTGVREGL